MLLSCSVKCFQDGSLKDLANNSQISVTLVSNCFFNLRAHSSSGYDKWFLVEIWTLNWGQFKFGQQTLDTLWNSVFSLLLYLCLSLRLLWQGEGKTVMTSRSGKTQVYYCSFIATWDGEGRSVVGVGTGTPCDWARQEHWPRQCTLKGTMSLLVPTDPRPYPKVG